MMSNYFLNYLKISQILSDRLYFISVVHDYWTIPEVDSGYLDASSRSLDTLPLLR